MLLTHTISLVEAFWTAMCALGMLFNSRQLKRAVGDFVELRRRRINSIREYAATTTVFMFATWTLVQVMFVLVGLVAMSVPSPDGRVAPTSYVLTGCFVMVSAILALSGYVIDKRRKGLIAKINSMEEGFDGSEARKSASNA